MIEVAWQWPYGELGMTYELWEQKLYETLRAGGIPVLPDGALESGSIMRFDSPGNWNTTIYRWQPDNGEPSRG